MGLLGDVIAHLENQRGRIKRRGLLDVFASNLGEIADQNMAAVEDTKSVMPEVAKQGRERLYGTGLGLLGTFAGVNAKTADKVALKAAEDMEKKGASRDDIWNATGWFRGPDKKWRFEVDDSGVPMLSPGRFDDLNQYSPLDSVMGHKPLFKAYPDMKKDVRVGPLKDGGGSYNSETDIIKLFPREGGDATPEAGKRQLSTLLHESQHAIQKREGFAPGGNMGMFRDVPPPDPAVIKALEERMYAARDAGDRATFNQLWRAIGDLERPDPLSQYRRLAGEAEARAVQSRANMSQTERRAAPPWQSYDVPWEALIFK